MGADGQLVEGLHHDRHELAVVRQRPSDRPSEERRLLRGRDLPDLDVRVDVDRRAIFQNQLVLDRRSGNDQAQVELALDRVGEALQATRG